LSLGSLRHGGCMRRVSVRHDDHMGFSRSGCWYGWDGASRGGNWGRVRGRGVGGEDAGEDHAPHLTCFVMPAGRGTAAPAQADPESVGGRVGVAGCAGLDWLDYYGVTAGGRSWGLREISRSRRANRVRRRRGNGPAERGGPHRRALGPAAEQPQPLPLFCGGRRWVGRGCEGPGPLAG